MKKIVDFIHQYKDSFFYFILSGYLKGMQNILDVGCGSSSPLGRINNKSHKIGIDIFSPSIAESRKKRIHNKYIKGNILDLSKYFKSNSIDCVAAFDVIEHFSKKEGSTLLKEMEKIAKKRIIVFTPNGFLKQGVYEKNSYQIHKSGWTKMDFEKRGYKVYGFRGPKFLRGEFASIKHKPWIIWGLIAFISEPFLYFFPSLSFHLLAIKKINE